MPDHIVWRSHHRSKQLQQLEECSATFICRTCGLDIRTSHSYSNCWSDAEVPDDGEEGVVIGSDTTSLNPDKTQTAVVDHVAVSKLPSEGGIPQCRGKGEGVVLSTIAKSAVDESFEPWVSVEITKSAVVTRCSTEHVTAVADRALAAALTVSASLRDQHLEVLTALADAREADEAAIYAHHNVASRTRSRLSSSSCTSRRPTREWSCSSRKVSSTSVKLQRKTIEQGPRPPRVVAPKRSENEIRTRKLSSSVKLQWNKVEDKLPRYSPRRVAALRRPSSSQVEKSEVVHRYNGVRTREGVRGFLVEIRPPRWKKTIWLGTFSTAIEAAAAYDAGAFYTNKPKRTYNLFHNPALCFPPLPSHLDIRDSSPKVMEDIKKFVKMQALSVASKINIVSQPKDIFSNRNTGNRDLAIVLPPMQSPPLPASEPHPMDITIDTVIPDQDSFATAAAAAAELPLDYESDFKIDLSSLSTALTASPLEMELGFSPNVGESTTATTTTTTRNVEQSCCFATKEDDPIWSSLHSEVWLPDDEGVFEAQDSAVLLPIDRFFNRSISSSQQNIF